VHLAGRRTLAEFAHLRAACEGSRGGTSTGNRQSDGVEIAEADFALMSGHADRARVAIGLSCRLCDRPNCRSRAFPPLHHRLALDPMTTSASPHRFERT